MIEFYPESIYYPRESVERKMRKGDLQPLEKQLFEFAKRHREDIISLAKEDEEEPSDETLMDNLRASVLSWGSVNPAADLGDMIQEISKEVWYQNETHETSPEDVSRMWLRLYEKKWREAKMFEAFVLIDHHTPELVKILRGE